MVSSKAYCEAINSTLLGVPNKVECDLIEQSRSLDRGRFDIFLNMHRFLYNRNFSDFTFKDNSGKSIDEFPCNFTIGVFQTNQLCLSVSSVKSIHSIDCDGYYTDRSTGFICKQCNSMLLHDPLVSNKHGVRCL